MVIQPRMEKQDNHKKNKKSITKYVILFICLEVIMAKLSIIIASEDAGVQVNGSSNGALKLG